MSGTPRFALPFLSPGQAQKEAFHNEALQMLDCLVVPAVEEMPLAFPPASPAPGACFIVGENPVAEWVGKQGQIAAWTAGGWRFIPPREGMTPFVLSIGKWITYLNGLWVAGELRGSALILQGQQVVGARAASIAAPAGGVTIDAEARAAIGAVLGAMRGHGLIET